MNGFASHGLDEDAFAEKGNIVKAFDAFRKPSLTSYAGFSLGLLVHN
jgi:hypothetical protein